MYMEEGKSACKQWKKKKNTTVSFHGGGIGGVVVLGGALAAAALIGFFANRINKGRPTNKDQSIDSDSSKNSTLKNKKNTDEESEGLQLLVHPSPPSVHLNPCCKSSGTSEMGSAQIDSNELISTKNPILEEISVLEINGGKGTLKNGDHDESFVSDVTNQRNISLCKDNGKDNEEHTLQVREISSVLEEEVKKINDAGEEPPSLEVIEEVKREEEASEIVIVEQLDEDDVKKINDAGEEPPLLVEAIEEAKKNEGASSEISIAEQVEENPPMKSIEEEDADLDDDDDDESEEEKSEDSSEETVDSSMESNAEAIWPTESIEKLSLALKEMNNNYQISGEKIGEEDGTVKNDSSSKDGSFYEYGKEDESTRNPMVISDNKETIKLLTVKDHPVKSGKLRMLILSILGTVLLLLMLGFFTHHEALFSYLVNGDSIL